MKEKMKKYEEEMVLLLRTAAVMLEREHPDYGQAETMLTRVHECLKYARQCNAGTFRGEEW